MGRLSEYKYREIIAKLKRFGFEFRRQAAGSHEIWHNPVAKRFTTVPNHTGDMPEGTLRAILKQADINVDDFIKSKYITLYKEEKASNLMVHAQAIWRIVANGAGVSIQP